MKKFSSRLVLVAGIAALVVGLALASTGPIRGLIDGAFNRETYTTSGEAFMEQMKAASTLTVATGTFGVPVVVCNTFGARAYPKKADSSADLASVCTGTGDEKATVIVQPEVQAVIDLKEIRDEDIEIRGDSIKLTVPRPKLATPVVDAETDVVIVSIESSIWPGKLPDDYIAKAAAAGKVAAVESADESGLLKLGESSTRSVFKGLLGSFGFKEVDIKFRTVDEP